MAHVVFEPLPPGSHVAGGAGGGEVTGALWLHSKIEELGIRKQVEEVLAGLRPLLSSTQ